MVMHYSRNPVLPTPKTGYLVLPVLPEYSNASEMGQALAPLLEDMGYIAYIALCWWNDFETFKSEIDSIVTHKLDSVPDGDGLGEWNKAKMVEFWLSPRVEVFLDCFFHAHIEHYRALIGPRVDDKDFLVFFNQSRPQAVVLTTSL